MVSTCACLRIELSGFEPCSRTLRCVLRQDTSLLQCLSVQVYKWVPAKLNTGAEVTLRLTQHHMQGEKSRNSPLASCCRNWGKLRPDGYANLPSKCSQQFLAVAGMHCSFAFYIVCLFYLVPKEVSSLENESLGQYFFYLLAICKVQFPKCEPFNREFRIFWNIKCNGNFR